jgi:hypothetical protein
MLKIVGSNINDNKLKPTNDRIDYFINNGAQILRTVSADVWVAKLNVAAGTDCRAAITSRRGLAEQISTVIKVTATNSNYSMQNFLCTKTEGERFFNYCCYDKNLPYFPMTSVS